MKLFGNTSNSGHKASHTAAPRKSETPPPAKGAILPSQDKMPPAPRPARTADAAQGRTAAAAAGQKNSGKSAASGSRKKLRAVFIIAGAVVLAILLAVAYFLFIYAKPPDVLPGFPSPSPVQSGSTAEPDASPTPTVKPTKDPRTTEDPEETEPPDDGAGEGEAPVIPASAERKEGVYTTLLVGVDKASNSTDTIMVVSFDTKNHTLTGTSIPRDTLINIGWFTTPKKINAVYPGYQNDGKDPVEGIKTHMKKLLGFEVDNYVVVYLQAVEDAVDAIGGVEFDVPFNMYYSDPDQDLLINIKAGKQVLNGSDALKLCRYRSGYAGADLTRIEMQHDFLKALSSQMMTKGISNLPALVSIILRDVDTDLTGENLVFFMREFLKCKSDDIVFQTAPNDGSGINDISFVGLRVNEWLKMVNDSINPYKQDVTIGNVDILTFGWGGMSVGSTTGAIAGGWNSFYCISCAVQSEGKVLYHGPGEHVDFTQTETGTGETGTTGTQTGTEQDGETETEQQAPPEPTDPPVIEIVYPDDEGGLGGGEETP